MPATYTPVHEALARVAHDRPFDATRLLIAGVLGVVGIVAVAMWSSAAFTAYDGFADRFVRSKVPGEVIVDSAPQEWYVYAEGQDAATLPHLRVRVTDPLRRTVPVQVTPARGVAYEHSDPQSYAMGNVVARFRATQVGPYQVVASTTSPVAAQFAVGTTPYGSGATWVRLNRLGMAALWLTVVGLCLWILFAPVIPHGWRGRERRISLLSVFPGVPAALAAATVWDGFAVPDTRTHGSRGVEGWLAVVYELPGWLLVIGVAASSVVFASMLPRSGARGWRRSLWASGLVLVGVVVLFTTNVADALRPPG